MANKTVPIHCTPYNSSVLHVTFDFRFIEPEARTVSPRDAEGKFKVDMYLYSDATFTNPVMVNKTF